MASAEAFDFTQHLTQHHSALKYFALSLTRDENDADDLVQETTLKALIYKDKFAENTNLRAWLYTIMKNIFINNYRIQSRQKLMLDGSKDLYHLNIPDYRKVNEPDAALNFKQIHACLMALDAEYAEPLRLYFEGYKYKEIADKYDLPIGTVKSRIFLARKMLSEQLQEFRRE